MIKKKKKKKKERAVKIAAIVSGSFRVTAKLFIEVEAVNQPNGKIAGEICFISQKANMIRVFCFFIIKADNHNMSWLHLHMTNTK